MKTHADLFLQHGIYEKFHRRFSSTAKLQSDYWYVWVKSGLLNYVCRILKEKYAIPRLKEELDYSCGEVFMSDDSVSVDSHEYFDKWDRKDEFKSEVYGYIEQLRLPRLAYDEMFDRIFYGSRLELNLKWSGVDSDAWFVPIGLSEELVTHSPGYTRDESREVVKMARFSLKRGGDTSMDVKKINLSGYGKSIQRKIRQVEDKKLYVAMLNQLRLYRSRKEVDYSDSKESIQISEKCASRIASELDLDDFTSVAFRTLASRLKKNFPIIKEFVSSR